MEDDGSLDKLPGKEGAAIKRQMSRMKRNFEGMLNLQGIPGALFVIDSHNEAIAIAEANRLKIPVIALVDSNSDPSLINFPIPGNDDSTKSIRIIVDVILEAIQSGASKRVEAPTRRKDITPVTLEPDFIDQEDEPEITLPEGYEETDFDDRRPRTDEATKVEEPTVAAEEKPVAVEPEPEAAKPVAEEPSAKVEESKAEEPADKKEEPTQEEPQKS
jgi:small subunit ribosomal protein S2